jgi:hypothetical protein
VLTGYYGRPFDVHDGGRFVAACIDAIRGTLDCELGLSPPIASVEPVRRLQTPVLDFPEETWRSLRNR